MWRLSCKKITTRSYVHLAWLFFSSFLPVLFSFENATMMRLQSSWIHILLFAQQLIWLGIDFCILNIRLLFVQMLGIIPCKPKWSITRLGA